MTTYPAKLHPNPIDQQEDAPLKRDYIYPPFSVLNARDGYWQKRKKFWIDIGIESGQGRKSSLLGNSALLKQVNKGTSIFDPVLTELLYRWFCPPGGQIVDPFAGGSVRGIVAACLGLNYWGCDIRAEQTRANRRQASKADTILKPVWVTGDALRVLSKAPEADLVFSCPPYGDLERYSDLPRDLSNMDYHTFLAAYNRIILRACKRLRENRFAAFVVGDFRDRKGHYRDFVSATIAAFKAQGLQLYNEAILVTQAGTLPLRIRSIFDRSRKLGKSHQNVLVFVKGDWRKAAEACCTPPKKDP